MIEKQARVAIAERSNPASLIDKEETTMGVSFGKGL